MVTRSNPVKFLFLEILNTFNLLLLLLLLLLLGYAVAQLVEALPYKSEGRLFDSRWCHWNFSLTYPSGRTMALGLTQTITEMSTRNIS
jgi:hypothetical protein